jgi:hypothetical protein
MSQVFYHCATTTGRIRTLDIRIMSQVSYHYATTTSGIRTLDLCIMSLVFYHYPLPVAAFELFIIMLWV